MTTLSTGCQETSYDQTGRTGNRELVMLDASALRYWSELGSVTQFAPGETVLARGGCALCHVIIGGAVSIRFGASGIEIDLLGAGELINIGALLETDENEHFAVAIARCKTLSMTTGMLKQVLQANPDLRPNLLKYVQRRIIQSMRAAECHLSHPAERRLATWIAIATTLLDQPELKITHRELSIMLGVRRPTVTLALQGLEGCRAIWSRRNRIVVRDRDILIQNACACLAARYPGMRSTTNALPAAGPARPVEIVIAGRPDRRHA